ncbi:MAG: MjaI family restriction endonuclease [Ignavibacteriales bacterium]|nr:MjaI family restriction endonuclease [Ignavibacteriales bacterium]MCF8307050.1 MjaI family restriction endonuclease [Ignavibacteriales bacterium]MCF8316673.1 MjaI family restriction endonuclease [Ignavibacteriales bacterium]MCF8438329.1 MjaI family restriction endonuclease [Ignavibacteriales bacterium]
MAKEWILNSAMNRFQLNFKRNVGPTSESIRKCSPKTLDEWREYYFNNVKTREHIENLGKKLYVKISEVIQSEVEDVTENDCIEYMTQLVIDRTYDGYMTEIQTIYGQLQNILDVPIQPAPDEWDRLFNVDFFIQVGRNYIGLQIKPVNSGIQLPEIFKEYALQGETHKKFTEVFGGKVFYLFSTKVGDKKKIQNREVINEIKQEIIRLESE